MDVVSMGNPVSVMRARFPALAEAFQRGTFGDFLDALTTPDAPLLLTAQREGERHIAISSARRNVAPPAETSLAPEVARMVVHGAHITARDREEAEEHDMRIVVWLPSWIGFALLGNAVLGIMVWGRRGHCGGARSGNSGRATGTATHSPGSASGSHVLSCSLSYFSPLQAVRHCSTTSFALR